MPHGQTWFSLLPFYESFRRLLAGLSKDGMTWVAHEDIGAQHVLAFGAVFLIVIAARSRRLRPGEGHEGRDRARGSSHRPHLRRALRRRGLRR